MKRRLLPLACVAAIAATAALHVGSAPAGIVQTPVATACPAGYGLLSVSSLEAAGPYILPRGVDTTGNNNGYVCGLARPDVVRDAFCQQGGGNACLLEQLGLPIYLFTDDGNPASQNTKLNQ